MKTKDFLLVALFLFLFTFIKAGQTITIQHGAKLIVYSNIDSALFYSSDGDTLYFSGGVTDTVTNINVKKKVCMIGVGYNPDSLNNTGGASKIRGNLIIFPSANGGSISGFNITGSISFGDPIGDNNITRYEISRCITPKIITDNYSVPNNLKGVYVSESIIGGVYPSYYSNIPCSSTYLADSLFFSNCIIRNQVYDLKHTSFDHCVFFDGEVFTNLQNSTINNSIFTTTNTTGAIEYMCCSINSYSDDITMKWFNTSSQTTVSINLPQGNNNNVTNNFEVQKDSVFVKTANAGHFSYSDNYHLSSTAKKVGNGSDNSEIGIFGGLGFKWSTYPSNPHITFKSIGSSNNANGKLDVHITVKAQGN